MRSRCDSGMPIPSSATVKRAQVAPASQPMRTSPPGWLYLTALCARLSSACPSRAGSARHARSVRRRAAVAPRPSRHAARRPGAIRSATSRDHAPADRRGSMASFVSPDSIIDRSSSSSTSWARWSTSRSICSAKSCAVWRVVDRAGGQGLGQQLDRGQRGAQLVADVGHEVAPDPLGAAQGGGLVQGNDESPAAQRHRVDREGARRPAGRAPPRRSPPRPLACAWRAMRVQRRRAEGRDQAHAGQLIARPLGQSRRCRRPARTMRSRSSTRSRIVSAAAPQEGFDRVPEQLVGHDRHLGAACRARGERVADAAHGPEVVVAVAARAAWSAASRRGRPRSARRRRSR